MAAIRLATAAAIKAEAVTIVPGRTPALNGCATYSHANGHSRAFEKSFLVVLSALKGHPGTAIAAGQGGPWSTPEALPHGSRMD